MVDVSHGPGIPFGGIGAGFSVFGKYGFVDVYFDGRHLNANDWRIDRAPTEKPAFAFQLTDWWSRGRQGRPPVGEVKRESALVTAIEL